MEGPLFCAGRAGGSASDLGGTQRTGGHFLKIPPHLSGESDKLLGVPEEDSLVLEIVVETLATICGKGKRE